MRRTLTGLLALCLALTMALPACCWHTTRLSARFVPARHGLPNVGGLLLDLVAGDPFGREPVPRIRAAQGTASRSMARSS